MRIARIVSATELTNILANATGQFILTNVRFGPEPIETIRVNVRNDEWTYWRKSTGRDVCRPDSLPFHVGSPSLLLSFDQLREWQDNFAIVHECIGERPLGRLSANDPAALGTLVKLQEASREMDQIDSLLDTLEVATPLYKSFSLKPNYRHLFAAGQLTDDGKALLGQVRDAVKTYDCIPELRSYDSDRASRRQEELGPRGQRLRQWHSQNELRLGDEFALRYVHDELKPLHLSGKYFRWSTPHEDLRLLSVDMLSECAGKPVWCEVKMAGDSWTTAALVQVLLYGAIVSTSNQQCRLKRLFPLQFTSTRPWLGVIVERRDDTGFSDDHGEAIGFCRDALVKDHLKSFFEGIHFLTVAARDDKGHAWEVTRAETIPWRDA